MKLRIVVIGGGAWGSALAHHLGRSGHAVRLWIREPDLVQRMRERRDNPVYLPGVRFPDDVEPVGELASAAAGAELAIAAVPSPFAREVYRRLGDGLARDVPLVVATKGIEERSLALPLAVAADELGADRPLAVLSGPSFAGELARELPTAIVVASDDASLAERVQQRISSPPLRLYTNRDPIGVQVAGAVKNVMAIASGVAASLGMGANSQAALITRGLAEVSRLGRSLGGHPATFSGLAGLGDLVLTCSGRASRNRQVGERLGRGERLEDILASVRAVPEGVHTTRSTRQLAARQGVEMPIVEQVHRMLYEDGAPAEALQRLMSRRLTAEERPSTPHP